VNVPRKSLMTMATVAAAVVASLLTAIPAAQASSPSSLTNAAYFSATVHGKTCTVYAQTLIKNGDQYGTVTPANSNCVAGYSKQLWYEDIHGNQYWLGGNPAAWPDIGSQWISAGPNAPVLYLRPPLYSCGLIVYIWLQPNFSQYRRFWLSCPAPYAH